MWRVQTIVQGIEATEIVPGRCEVIDENQPFSVVVDAARSPTELARLLDCLRELRPRRLILVTGCQGDVDQGVRPFIGEVAHYKVPTPRKLPCPLSPKPSPPPNVVPNFPYRPTKLPSANVARHTVSTLRKCGFFSSPFQPCLCSAFGNKMFLVLIVFGRFCHRLLAARRSELRFFESRDRGMSSSRAGWTVVSLLESARH